MTDQTNELPDEIIEKFQVLHEFAKQARLNLDKNIFDYVFGGAETETTVKRNRMAIETHALRPRVMRDVSKMDAGKDLFGMRLRLPVCLAPIGSLQQIAKGGGATAAKGAGRFGCAHMLSSVCEPGMDAVAEAAPDACRIFQLYVRGDHDWVDDKVRQAMDLGYKAFAVTIDLDAYSRRERDLSKRFVTHGRRAAVGETHQAQFNWSDVDRIKKFCDIPFILKGIATAEDAALCVDAEGDAVAVAGADAAVDDGGAAALAPDALGLVVEHLATLDADFKQGVDADGVVIVADAVEHGAGVEGEAAALVEAGGGADDGAAALH